MINLNHMINPAPGGACSSPVHHKALQHASSLPAAQPKELVLGRATYRLATGLEIPPCVAYK